MPIITNKAKGVEMPKAEGAARHDKKAVIAGPVWERDGKWLVLFLGADGSSFCDRHAIEDRYELCATQAC
jgi:hypothetical protein